MSGNPSVNVRTRANSVGILQSLVFLYSSWTTLLTNVVLFVGYYLFFYEVMSYSNLGLFLITIPYYLLVVLVFVSSCSATVALSFLRISRRRKSIAGMAESSIGVAVGAFVASCSCSLPLLAPVLYFIGLNAIEVSGVISFLASYQTDILGVIILINTVAIYYYLRLVSQSGIIRVRV
jgi:hypothetical protein